MKVSKFLSILFMTCFNFSCFAQSEASLLNCKNDRVDSVVFIKNVTCVEENKKYGNGQYEYKVSAINVEASKTNSFQDMLPSKTIIEKSIKEKMLVFATNAEPTYTGVAPITKFGVTYTGGAAKVGIKMKF